MNRFSILSILGILLISFTSCDLVKDFTYTVTPNPLEMHGDSLKFTVLVNIPAKGIQKKVTAEITPKIGTTSLGKWIIQGEKATGNGKTIFFKPGGTASFDMVVPYTSDMEAADVKITGTILKGLKQKKVLPEIKIADATIVTPLMVNKEFKMIYEDHNFKFEIEKTKIATLNFDRGQSFIKDSELKDQDAIDLIAWISAIKANPKITVNSISISGFASPDGIEVKNQNLSRQRTESARTFMMNLMKKVNSTNCKDTMCYTLNPKGEDFIGFKEQLQITSTISQSDKDLFLRVVEMNNDQDKKEQAMKDLGKTWTELEKDVFPKIRRAVIQVNYSEKGLTDTEINQALVNNTSILGVEELLYAAESLTNNISEKSKIYELAVGNFSADHRCHNNLGAVRFLQNRRQDAKINFEKSNSLKDNASSKNNLAGVYLLSGDKVQAKKLMAQTKSIASKNSSLLAYNNAILNIMNGEYSKAESNIKENCFNKALALVLQAKLPQALKTLETINASSETLYLKAIISARNGESVDAVINNLKLAFAKDSNLKSKASKDREFLKFMNDASFTSAVN